MEETKDSDIIDLENIRDDQERLYFRLTSAWKNRNIDPQKVREQFHELKLLQFILYLFISSGIIAFFILIFMNIYLIIIIIDVGVVLVYISYLKYITHKYRKFFKITKKEYKYLFKVIKKSPSISQLLFYSFIITITTLILIFSTIIINPLILIIVFGISFIYIYLDPDGDENDTSWK